MAKAKIDTTAVCLLTIWLVVLGALLYFAHTTAWGANLWEAVELLMLFWSVLSPLYVLIRMGLVYLRGRKAARLGLTLAQYDASRRAAAGQDGGTALPEANILARLGKRLLRLPRWELVVLTAALLLLGALVQHWRGTPAEAVDVPATGMLCALALYGFLGLEVLHRVWARWHHHLAPGSPNPAEISGDEPLPRSQRLWNAACAAALLFVLGELSLCGEGEMLAVLFFFIAPALILLPLAGLWRLVRSHLRQQHTRAA